MSAHTRAALAVVAIALAACSSNSSNNDDSVNKKPDYIRGTIVSTAYDGNANDLLTGGIGRTGLGTGACPAPAAPASPTVEELRTIAICNNYRALVDTTAGGGYGSLYGPNVDVNGTATTSEGKIAGDEHIAFADDGTGKQNVTLMVQIPTTFSTTSPCIVTATSSGSRGIYGAIGTAGEWGLKHGCAVAYTDKGTGNGAHDLAADMVNNLRGTRVAAATAGTGSQFTAALSASELAAYNAAFPNRWAFKHAHSQQNSEKDWGRDTLRSIEFAFYMVNQKYNAPRSDGTVAQTIIPSNTIVIASSVSNGAGAALAAAEQDENGLIDGVAVAEPQVQLNPPAGLVIRRGANAVSSHSKTLYDYFTLANLLEPCAARAAGAIQGAPILQVNAAAGDNRCAALAAAGLVSGATTTDQASDALAKMLAAGWETDAIPFMPTHYLFAVLPVALTYADAYAKANVKDNLCGYSFGATPVAGVPPVIPAAVAAQVFATGNGVPPASGLINIINNNSVGGAALDAASISPSTAKADYNYDGAKCLRDLLTATGSAGTTLRASIDAVKRTGNLRGKPAIIVHGRSDTLVPINHTSRPYYALNKTVDTASQLVYYEVTNAQHFDAFIGNGAFGTTAAGPGYDARLIPLHRYFVLAMDLMYAKLRAGNPLPPSQVVRTTPRGGSVGAVPAITPANVPPVAGLPTAGNAITFSNNTLTIPE